MRLLLINPNTSSHITQRLAQSAQAALQPGDTLEAVTATRGPQVVRNAADLREAESNAIVLAHDHAAGHDAIVLGISLDGAVRQLRERHGALAVVGMTESALLCACLCAERIGLLTLGHALLPLYRRRIEQVGVGSRVVACEAPELDSAFGAAPVEAVVLDVLAQACGRLRLAGAQAVVLAGAVLCGYAPALSARCGLPVFDGIACAVGQLRMLLAMAEWQQPA